MEDKRGAVDWTVGTLFRIVLAVILIALIGYGLVNQSFGPLVDNMKYRWEETTYLIKSFIPGGDNLISECYERKVSELADGDVFLRAVGVSEMTLANCQDGMCVINWSSEKFRKRDERLEKLESRVWVNYDFARTMDVDVAKKDWERYQRSVDFLESVGAGSFYDGYFTRKFVLFGDGSGGNNNVTAVWQSGDWYVQENGKSGSVYYEDDAAIDAFVEIVWSRNIFGDDDKVYWGYGGAGKINSVDLSTRRKYAYFPAGQEDCSIYCGVGMFANVPIGSTRACSYGTMMNLGRCCCSWKDYGFDVVEDPSDLIKNNIELIIGKHTEDETLAEKVDTIVEYSDVDEIDTAGDVVRLKKEFANIRSALLGEVSVDVTGLRSLVDGESVSIDGVSYLVSVEEQVEDFPLIVFESSSDKFALEFATFPKRRGELFPWVELRYFPVYLVEEENGKWVRSGDEEVYRLPENNWNDVYYGNLVGKFLWSKCR